MTTSFPYLAIAKRFAVPYPKIAAIAATIVDLDKHGLHLVGDGFSSEIHRAFVAERDRRRAIEAEADR